MVAERKNILMKIMSVLMALVMCFTFVVPVIAATSKTVNVSGLQSSKKVRVNIITGKGLLYSLGAKSTTVTVKNTGNYSVNLYKNLGTGYVKDGVLGPKQTKTYKATGSAKSYFVEVQSYKGKSSTVTVSVNAGSVY